MIFTCTNFTGHYPVGVAAVVNAGSRIDAARKLNEALKLHSLDGDAKAEDMLPLEEDVRVLNDGNY